MKDKTLRNRAFGKTATFVRRKNARNMSLTYYFFRIQVIIRIAKLHSWDKEWSTVLEHETKKYLTISVLNGNLSIWVYWFLPRELKTNTPNQQKVGSQ